MDTAHRLFAEHGFGAVSLARIAAAAGVSAKTVSRHFPTREGLYFADGPPVDDRITRAVRDRPPGETAYQAVRHALRAGQRFPGLTRAVRERPAGETVYEAIEQHRARAYATDGPAETSAARARVFVNSDQLRAYADKQFARQERDLAAIMAEDTAAPVDDPVPGVVAAALVAPLRWVFVSAQESLAAGTPPAEVAGSRDGHLERAYHLLGTAVTGYAPRGIPREEEQGGPERATPEE